MKIYDVSVSVKVDSDHTKAQLASGKQLNDIGLTCKKWLMGSTDGYHKWRVWVHDDDGRCFTYLKLKFRKVTVCEENLPIPSWCKNPSRLNDME